MNSKSFFIAFIAVFLLMACNNSSKNETGSESTEESVYGLAKVEVLYFHATRRCPTCNKIEEIARNVVLQDYSKSDVKFYAINFDEKENKKIADRYNISWSSLVITSGDKSEDITDLAFQVITTDPKQMTDRMKSIIDVYLDME